MYFYGAGGPKGKDLNGRGGFNRRWVLESILRVEQGDNVDGLVLEKVTYIGGM